MKKIFLLIFTFVLAACSTAASAGSADEFSRNQQTWQDTNVTHYKFDLNLTCFCAFHDQMPLTVEIQDGAVVSMKTVNGTEVLTSDPGYETFAKYATIDRIFSELEADRGGNADEVNI